MSVEARDKIVVCINDDCELVDPDNNYYLTWVDLRTVAPIAWCNKSKKIVKIKFEGEVVDRGSITLRPGETVTAMVQESLPPEWYYYKVVCCKSDDGNDEGSEEEETTGGVRGPSPGKGQQPPPGGG